MSLWLRRVVGQVAFLAFLATCALPPAIGADIWWNDDAACGPSELGPRHVDTAIGAPQPDAATSHCTLCHWLHAVSGATPLPGAVASVTLSPLSVVRQVAADRYTHSTVDRQSLRAPPAALAF